MPTYIALGLGENLAETLDIGNWTTDGQKIRAQNGTSSLNFRVSADNEILLTNDDINFLLAFISLFPNTLQVGFNANTGLYLEINQVEASLKVNGINSFLAGNIGSLGLIDNSQDAPANANTFKIIDNSSADKQSSTANVAAFFNSGSNANVSKILQNVLRSVCISGEGLTGKTNNTFYLNQASFQEIGVLFDCILKSGAITADRTLTLPDKSGELVVDTYAEKWTLYNATLNTTWETIAITDALATSLIEIVCYNNSGANKDAGVRQVGSALTRSLTIAANSSLTITVKTDASKQIQFYASIAVDIDFYFSSQL